MMLLVVLQHLELCYLLLVPISAVRIKKKCIGDCKVNGDNILVNLLIILMYLKQVFICLRVQLSL